MPKTFDPSHTPFELPIEVVTWRLPGRDLGPQSISDGTLALALAFKASLWRAGCLHASRGEMACADRALPGVRGGLVCAEAGACAANLLMPLDPKRQDYLPARVAARLESGSQGKLFVRLDLRGRRAQPMRGLAITALQLALRLVRYGQPGKLDAPSVEHVCAARRAEPWLAGSPRPIVLEAVTPWMLDKAAPSAKFDSAALARRFADGFAGHAAQRLYKYVALALAEDDTDLTPGEQNDLCVRARDRAREALAAPNVRWIGGSACIENQRNSASNGRRFRGVTIVGGTLEVRHPTPAQAAWLAALESLGGGELTSEGYGCLRWQAGAE